MTRYVVKTGVSVAACCGIGAGTVHAQMMTAPVSMPFTVKLGVYLPTDSNQATLAGSTHFDLGVTYEFGKSRTASPLVYGVYADNIFGSTKTIGTIDAADEDAESRQEGSLTETLKGKSSGFDVGVEGRYLFAADPRASIKPYAGLGIGFYSALAKAELDYSDGTLLSASRTDSGLGGKIMAGVELKSGFLGEASYNFFPGDNDGFGSFSGVGINLGYRF